MSGAAKRSDNPGQANDLAEGAGETVPLSGKGNFPSSPHPDGHVYFLTDGEVVKIGFSSNPKKRVGSIQTGHAKPLTLLGTIVASVMDEMSIHELFSDLRVRGEWFQATPDLLAFIDEICSRPPPVAPPLQIDSRRSAERVLDVTICGIEAWAQGRDPWDRCRAQSLVTVLRWKHREPDDIHARVALALNIEGLQAIIEKRRCAPWHWKALQSKTYEEAAAIIAAAR